MDRHLRRSLEGQSGLKVVDLQEAVRLRWFNLWDGRTRDVNQMQRKADSRGIPKHVEMLFGKTSHTYLYKVPPTWIWVHLHQRAFHQSDFPSWLKGRLGLLAAISPLSAQYLHPASPTNLFFQLTHFSEAKYGVQTSPKQFRPDASSHFCATQEPLLISPDRLLAIMTFPPEGNMPG